MRALKRILPPGWISPLKRAAAIGKVTILRLVSRSGFLSSLYYATVSGAFRREHRAVMKGLVRHHTNKESAAKLFQLRRNIHRLEKALLMRPRRETFAVDYIGETVTYFRECERIASGMEEETIRWAKDVLHAYFEAVGEHPLVERARVDFLDSGSEQEGSPERIPYRRSLQHDPVRYEDLLALAGRRRSVRWFLQEPPPRDLIDKALALANQAPSACNRQPFFFRIFDDPEMVRKISAIPMGTAGFHENIPAIAVVVGDLSAYFSERDRHGIYVDASLAIMAFMLGLETVGLSSCPLNWPDIGILERRMSRALNLPAHQRVVMLIAIGHPDPNAMVAYSQKRDLSEIRSYNVI